MCFRKKYKSKDRFRKIKIHSSNQHPDDQELAETYTQNFTKSSKYTIFTFLPYALAYQFTKLTNIYFAGMIALFLIPSISPFDITAILTPFSFIMMVSLLREGMEDIRRHTSDWNSNRSKALKIKDGKVRIANWKDLIVGDLVIIQKDERIPADLVLLASENEDGVAHLETSTLDGEKHLKPRLAPKETQSSVEIEMLHEDVIKSMHKNKRKKKKKIINTVKRLTFKLEGEFHVQKPQPSIYKFEGFFKLNSSEPKRKKTDQTPRNKIEPINYNHIQAAQSKVYPLTIKNFLFKGTKIRNVDWIVGLVVYTGKDTKIQLNGQVSRSKTSKLESSMHRMIILLFLVQLFFSILSSFGKTLLDSAHGSEFSLFFSKVNNIDDDSSVVVTILRFFVLLNTMIPISLLVNLEFVKMFQAARISDNLELMSYERDIKCKALTSSINEELGSIEYVLSDKTGTLTKNKMEMRAFCVGEKVFGGTFIKTEDNRLRFQQNFEPVLSGVTTPAKTLSRKIIEQSILSQGSSFDQELLTIMLSDGKLSEALPIPQLMRGENYFGCLQEIREEDEYSIEYGETHLLQNQNSINNFSEIQTQRPDEDDDEDNQEKDNTFSPIHLDSDISSKKQSDRKNKKSVPSLKLKMSESVPHKKSRPKLSLSNSRTQVKPKFNKTKTIEIMSSKVSKKVIVDPKRKLSVNNQKSKKSSFFGNNNHSQLSDLQGNIDNEDNLNSSFGSFNETNFSQANDDGVFTSSNGHPSMKRNSSNQISEFNSIKQSPNLEKNLNLKFNKNAGKKSLNSIDEVELEESHRNPYDNDQTSLIESVVSNFKEQGLSVDGIADNNDNENIVFSNYKNLIEEYLKCASICHECLVEIDDNGKRYFQSSSPDEVAICQRLKDIGVEFQGIRKEKGYVKFFNEDRIFNIEMLFEFDSDRKKQSVIVREGTRYKLYVKGADSSILPSLKEGIEHPYKEQIDTDLLNFSILGYRTLVFGMRYLTIAEFEDYKDKYNKAMESTSREKDLFNLAQEVEKDLILLGSSAVEDSLQDKVKETITRILEADIKVWMITGDKLETAENIGLMSGIINQKMKRYYLKEVTKANFMEKCRILKNNFMKQDKEVKSCIIFDMRLVDFIFSRQEEFSDELNILGSLIMESDALICARSTPKQKAKLVKFVRDRKKICLAIGDGANDVNMIGEANVGVGLYGEEGLQAVQASDFAIANFRYLWKLVLVQGRQCHIRLSRFILLFIYKNVLYTMPQFIYGFYSYFSGISVFDDYYLIMYNLVFTSFTVSYIGGCDVDISYWKVLPSKTSWFQNVRNHFKSKKSQKSKSNVITNEEFQHPLDESFIDCKKLAIRKIIKNRFQDLYYISQKNIYFNVKGFCFELINALMVTILMVITSHHTISDAVLTNEGFTGDHWAVSFTIYTSILMGTNIALLFRSKSIVTVEIVAILISSVIPYYLFMYFYDKWEWLNLQSSYSTKVLFSSYHFYLCVVLNCMYVVIFEMVSLLKFFNIKPTLAEYFKILIKFKKEDDRDCFQEGTIKNIKKFWNPMMRQKAKKNYTNNISMINEQDSVQSTIKGEHLNPIDRKEPSENTPIESKLRKQSLSKTEPTKTCQK